MTKRSVRNLILLIEYLALAGSVGLILYSIRTSKWEVMAASLAVIAAIIANFNSQRISWKQEDDYDADIEVDFDLKAINKMVLLYIHNTGGSKAYNISVQIMPHLEVLNDEIIDQLNISYLNKNEKIQYYVSSSVDMFAENNSGKRPKDYNIQLIFCQSENGRKITRKKTISIENFRKTTSPDSDYERFFVANRNIADKLEKLEKAVLKLTKK